MKLESFQIENYRSIINSNIVKLSENDNVTILAGQNESGKSSILKALYDFERKDFEADSKPFSLDITDPIQKISCTYKIEDDDDLFQQLTNIVKKEYNLKIADTETILDITKIRTLREFTITRTKEEGNISITIDDNAFNILRFAILDKAKESISEESALEQEEKTREKYINITDDDNSKFADILWNIAPKIIFFDDFCDLLPDKIFISYLKEKKTDAKGYRAVKNLEKILKTDFVTKDTETDAVRSTIIDIDNDTLSINFQKDWGQRIHGENKIIIKYEFQKRDDVGEKGSYINFYVATREKQPLPPKQRSKGLIWFLSLWLELKAQDLEYDDLILLLDEPDQHLHVKAQEDILKLINTLAKNKENKKGNQILCATHSPYMIESKYLNRIKLIINDEKEGTKIEDIVSSKIDTQNKRDALQPIAYAMGLNVSEFSILGKKNVILEGISDFYYFLGMKKILKLGGDYQFVPGIGVRQIHNLISLCIGYGLDWIAIIDDDPTEGGKDSKTKFDEIKDYVFGGEENETRKRVYILEKIVGIENIFTYEDLKLINSTIINNSDKTKAVGHGRKVLFSTLFFEKVNKEEIIEDQLSPKAKNNFVKAFNFIENYFKKN